MILRWIPASEATMDRTEGRPAHRPEIAPPSSGSPGPVTEPGAGIEAPGDEERLVNAPLWATFILTVAPFVLGFLVILALRWLV